MIQDFSKIYDKMLEEQTKKSTIVPLIKEEPSGVKNIVNKKPKEEPLEKFLLSLNEKLKQKQKEKQELEEKIKKKQELEEQLKQNQISPIKEVVDNSLIQDSEENLDNNTENNLEEVEKTEESDEFENFYIKELEKIDKSSSKKLIKENEELSNQIQQLQTQITRLNVEAGTWGGGDIGGGGSGSGGCDCDRLISGDQSLILNSDGTISFPNDVITTPTGLINVFGDLSATGRIYQNGNDLQSEIESISATTKSVYTTVNTNSAYWSDVYTTFKNASSTFLTSETDSQTLSFNDLNKNLTISNGNTVSLSSLIPDTFVRALTSNWENTYTTFKNASSTFLTSETDSQTLSFNDLNKNLTISNGNTISLSSLIPDTSVRALTSNWQSTYTTVSSNSATWNYQGTDIKALTSGWVGGNQAYTNLISNSAAYLSGVDLSFLSVSGNWNSTYSTVQSNSANWNYQGTDIKALTGNWNNTSNIVQSNSSQWASNVDTNVRALTSNWENTYTTFKNVSSTFLTSETDSQTLSFNDTLKTLSISNGNTISLSSLVDSTSIDTSVRALTSNWQSTYTTVSSNSANWNYQGTDIKALTSAWVGGNSAYTNLISNSSAYLSSVDLSFLSVSGNWNSVYTTVSSNSATWNYQGTDIKALTADWVGGNSAYTTVLANSASWAVDSSVDTDVRLLTSDWVGGNQAYTNLISNSAAYLSSVDLSFLSVSGNWDSTYTTVSSNSATWSSSYTILQANSATWSSGVLGTSETLIAEVKNAELITLNRGDVVYAFGSTGNKLSVKLASNLDDTTSSKTIGVVNGTIAAGGTGFITSVGRMDQLALGSFNDGDSLWLDSTAGDFTNVKPIQPRHGVFIGIVERANSGDGIAYIKIQNGYELNEIHDVLVTNVSAGDFLQRNSSNTLWVPVPLSANEWNLTYSIVQSNSSNWNLGGSSSDVSQLSANWESTYTTVQSNSSTWNYDGSDIKALTADWIGGNEAYTNLISNSAAYLSGADLSFLSVSGNWDSTYSTVLANSANWNYQGTDIKSLTANWQSAYTTLSSNSASYVRTNTSDATPVYFIRALTQTQYDAISIKDPNTLYFITT